MAIETSMGSSPKHAEALGRAIASFALLETALLMLLGYILGVGQRRARVLYEGVAAFNAKVDIMKQLLPHAGGWIDSHEQKEILKILAEVQGINTERVKYIHGLWTAGVTDGTLGLSPMTAKKQKSIDVSVEDLELFEARILKAYSQIMPRYILPRT